MISVLEHIEYLVSRHDCVVVPGFGAFIAQHSPSHCDADGIKWHCPERQLSFNADVAHNDGLLASSVMRMERCSYDDAAEMVRDSVAAYRQQLEADGELSFGKLGIFKLQNGSVVFVPYTTSDAASEYFGLGAFSMVPLAVLDKREQNVGHGGSWKFTVNKTYMKIAASIIVLLALSFALSTPVANNRQQDYASMGDFRLSDDGGAFPIVSQVRELAIMQPPADDDSVVVKGYRSMGVERPRNVAMATTSGSGNNNYYLIVCSVLSQAEADKFIAHQHRKEYDFKVLSKRGKYRVYVATGNSVKELMQLKYAIADDYPDAWVHYSR